MLFLFAVLAFKLALEEAANLFGTLLGVAFLLLNPHAFRPTFEPRKWQVFIRFYLVPTFLRQVSTTLQAFPPLSLLLHSEAKHPIMPRKKPSYFQAF